jgi:alkaline phosphatase D
MSHSPQFPLYPLQQSATSRRSFLALSTSLAAAAVWSSRASGITLKNASLPDHPFQLGVASGDPSPTGFVIWTRLAPKPLEGGGMPPDAVEVAWQVAEDEQFSKVVRRGTTTAAPQWAHSVHVEVEGLAPDRWYFYQFQAAGETSPVGRARTAPLADTMPQSLRFTFASCQHYETGLYTAYEHMAQDDLDLVIHLGDYIYEGGATKGKVRGHVGEELDSLTDYRNRHAQYKTDAALQLAHARFPWLVTWDDHELDNNCAGAISEQKHVTPEEFLKRRARAYQAYYEHMPLRRAALPQGPDMLLYRRVSFGRLAEFSVLDARQYRSDQPCGDGNKPQCAEALDPARSLLGQQQEQWLVGGLTASTARWNVLAQQVMMARVDRLPGDDVGFSMDQWPGYEGNRRRLLKLFAERKVANPVVIGGDIHSNWANNLIADFDDFDSRIVASEFVGTAISSGGDGTAQPKDLERTLAENPFVKWHNAERGYVRCLVSPERWQADYQVVPYVTRPGAPLLTRASFVVQAGQPGVEPA